MYEKRKRKKFEEEKNISFILRPRTAPNGSKARLFDILYDFFFRNPKNKNCLERKKVAPKIP